MLDIFEPPARALGLPNRKISEEMQYRVECRGMLKALYPVVIFRQKASNDFDGYVCMLRDFPYR